MSVVRLILIVMLLHGSLLMSAFAEDVTRMSYVFQPDMNSPDGPVLHTRLQFQGSESGGSTLVLPTTWAGQRDLYKGIRNLRPLDSITSIIPSKSEGIITLRYPPRHKVALSYDLASDWTGDLRHPKEFRTVISSTNFIFNGQNGLVYPEISQTKLVRISFEWRSLPRGWTVASSFGTAKRRTQYRGEWRRVHDALFAVGDFRTTRISSGGEQLTLAARGVWSFSDRQAADEIVRLLGAERRFWRETELGKFLVVLTSYDQDSGSSDGTAFTNCFLLYLSKKDTLNTDIQSQLAHEIFHAWNPYKMGQPSGDATEWFTEGFTRYYQDRVLLSAGLITYAGYIERLNRIIGAYWSSPQRSLPRQQWLDLRRIGKAEDQLPYERGAVIALWMDETIRRDSGNKLSLDDRMVALLETKGTQLTTDSLISVLCNGVPPEVMAQLRSFVEEGVLVPMPSKLEAGCATVMPETSQPTYKPTGMLGCKGTP